MLTFEIKIATSVCKALSNGFSVGEERENDILVVLLARSVPFFSCNGPGAQEIPLI